MSRSSGNFYVSRACPKEEVITFWERSISYSQENPEFLEVLPGGGLCPTSAFFLQVLFTRINEPI